jgi:dATP/dGTP diphosphohydrolase, N-terminal
MKTFELRPDRFCPECGVNNSYNELHDSWCPNSAPNVFQTWIDDGAEWVDEEADVNDSAYKAELAAWEAEVKFEHYEAVKAKKAWDKDQTLVEAYHAPERPDEDWGLRDQCLEGPCEPVGVSAYTDFCKDFYEPTSFIGPNMVYHTAPTPRPFWEPNLSSEPRPAYFIHPDGVYVDGVRISRNEIQSYNADSGKISLKTGSVLEVGGAPTRATTLPESATDRKQYPVASGVLDYFPDSLVAISHLSQKGNDQHNPGQPLHWDRSKSTDEADTMIRHFLQRGSLDTDGVRHTVKMAWRALALLQKEIEQESN